MPLKNLAVETLRKLLNNEIKLRQQTFLIQSCSFAEMLEESIRKYQNRAIEAAAFVFFVCFVVKVRDPFASPFALLRASAHSG